MIWTLLVLAVTGTTDPRLDLTRLQIEGRTDETLAAVEQRLEEDPQEAAALGLQHLQGHLLESLGRRSDAHEAFAQSMGSATALASYSRYRLALNQLAQGHPEVAAGLLAGLLSRGAPEPLVRPSTKLLVRSLANGGDCRLLGHLAAWRIPEHERRSLEVAQADCDLRLGNRDQAVLRWMALVETTDVDEAARAAAERLARLEQREIEDGNVALLVGRVFHRHRQFELSISYLKRGLEVIGLPGGESSSDDKEKLETLYALARGHFWQENYLVAATNFGRLAAASREPEEKARALYQQGRCYELSGNWDAAGRSYRISYLEDPEGVWADAALISALRVQWRSGYEDSGLQIYEVLSSKRSWRDLRARAALFMASSDLVRGRIDRAASWLDQAERSSDDNGSEVEYWKGRLAELEGNAQAAVESYLGALTSAGPGPFALSARERLEQVELAPTTTKLGQTLARSNSLSSLYHAWVLLGDGNPDGDNARRQLERGLAATEQAREFLEIDFKPASEWPLWESSLRQPEEMLLALGLWREGAPAIRKHFPPADPSLAYTSSQMLSQAEAYRESLRIAEILHNRAEDDIPEGLLPLPFRQLLYPMPFSEIVRGEAERHGVEPHLLAALIREESRFDPSAVSPASARGLTQFVLPTAKRLGPAVGRSSIEAAELHEPQISIALGAAYLAELSRKFGPAAPEVIAAYNAGERQAALWRIYCYSREPEEYLSKVGFAETRGYLQRVLYSRNQYRELYGNEGSTAEVE